jgi:hypothetical protein
VQSRCAVRQCDERLRAGLVMCEKHWQKVSERTRIEICRLHDSWVETHDAQFRDQWLDAIIEAANYVRACERRKHPPLLHPPTYRGKL